MVTITKEQLARELHETGRQYYRGLWAEGRAGSVKGADPGYPEYDKIGQNAQGCHLAQAYRALELLTPQWQLITENPATWPPMEVPIQLFWATHMDRYHSRWVDGVVRPGLDETDHAVVFHYTEDGKEWHVAAISSCWRFPPKKGDPA